ncbi:MAG: hypothetical protein IJN25_10075 [Clostridia bacterium]|nr:hypothetical protein [Clostridia bacterium]
MLYSARYINKERKIMLLAAACVFLVGLFLQGCTGRLGTPNSYNSYALQAARWLEGHLDLGQNYSHLEIAAFNGKYYNSFPPFPSVVLLPFVLLFGTATPDGLISLWFAAAGAALAAKLSFLYGKSEKEAFFWAVFITVGSNLLSIMCTGWVWFIAQTMAFTFLLAAFCTAKQGKTWCALLLTACAAGCRPFSVLCLPIFLYLLHKAGCRFSRRTLLRVLPAAVLCLFYALLNGLRFGNPLEFGHNYLPEFLAEPQFGFGYVAENVKTLVRLPALQGGQLVFPEFNGFNFFLASPLFISCLCRLVRHKKDAADWCATGLLLLWLLLFCMHRTMGGWHFGNRYTIDLLPPALWLILRKKGDFSGHIPLFFLGFSLHFYGFLTL